jgi:preprotein translocase subunit SecD
LESEVAQATFHGTKGDHMYRMIVSGTLAVLFSGLFQAQGPFSIHAASADPVSGWERMELENQAVWVSPTASLTSVDVGRAQSITMRDGKKAVAMEFTDAGAEKMRKLSTAQMDKLIAVVLDGKLIWAPKVRSEIGKEAILTGNGPNGLPDALIKRILESVGQR